LNGDSFSIKITRNCVDSNHAIVGNSTNNCAAIVGTTGAAAPTNNKTQSDLLKTIRDLKYWLATEYEKTLKPPVTFLAVLKVEENLNTGENEESVLPDTELVVYDQDIVDNSADAASVVATAPGATAANGSKNTNIRFLGYRYMIKNVEFGDNFDVSTFNNCEEAEWWIRYDHYKTHKEYRKRRGKFFQWYYRNFICFVKLSFDFIR